jgi:hypothetical protein
MPLIYQVDQPILRFNAKGDVKYTSGLETTKRALRDAREVTQTKGEPLWNLLFDLRESTESRSEDELKGIAMALAQNMDILTGRMAVLVVDPHYVGVAAAFSVFAEQLGQEPQLFGTPEEAEAWLAG